MNAAWSWETLDALGFRVVALLLSIAWQSSLLLVAAAVVAHMLRRQRAAVRHAVWLGALAMVPLLPLLGWVASGARAPKAEIPLIPAYSTPGRPPHLAADLWPATPTAVVPSLVQQSWSMLSYPWALALGIYVAGAAALLLMVLVGRLHLSRWLREGRVVTDPHVLQLSGTAAKQLGLRSRPMLVEHPHVPSPLTAGSFHPVIFLPTGLSQRLSDSEMAAVALHELAHVQRRDAPVILAMSCLRAALFFHPLIWFACRKVSLLAEAACDEVVVGITKQPLPYARMLTRLAEELMGKPAVTEMAVGLALSKGAFLSRIQAILSHSHGQVRRFSRIAMGGIILVAATSVALAVVLPLGERSASDSTPEIEAALDATAAGDSRKNVPDGGDAEQDEQEAIRAVRNLGGVVTRDESLPGRPIVDVVLTGAVKDSDLECLKALTELRSLRLLDTRVTDAGLKELGQFKGLRTLSLDGTAITGVGLAELAGLPGLEELSLAYTSISDDGLSGIGRLHGLRALDLGHTAITDAGLRELRGLENLQRLYLGSTRVSDVGLSELKGLGDLQVLDVADTWITDTGLKELKGIGGLRALRLGGTKVTDVSLTELTGLGDLRNLLLDRTRVTPDGVRTLRKALPGLGVDGVVGVPMQAP